MTRRRLVPATLLLAVGCLHSREPVARPQMPTAIEKKYKPPPADENRPPETAPVRVLPSAAATAAPAPIPLEPVAFDDTKKGVIERLKERREERVEKREEKKAGPPTKEKEKDKPPVANAPGAPGDIADWVKKATDKLAATPGFECRLVRREVVNGKESATEEILFKHRPSPFSIYMRNIGDAGRGREVVYVAGKNDGKMTVVTGEGDNRLVGAGFKTSLRPDSPMATSKSRHQITDAGFVGTLKVLEKGIAAKTVTALGLVTRKEYPYPLAGFDVALKPGDDKNLPQGGTLTAHFDPKPESPGYALPVLMVTTDAAGKEVEYYCNDRFVLPVKLTDADFDPAKLGKK